MTPVQPLTKLPTDLPNSQSLLHKWWTELLTPLINGTQCLLIKFWVSFFLSSKPLNFGPPTAWASTEPLLRTDWPYHKTLSDLPSDHVTLYSIFPTLGSFQPCSCLSAKDNLYVPWPLRHLQVLPVAIVAFLPCKYLWIKVSTNYILICFLLDDVLDYLAQFLTMKYVADKVLFITQNFTLLDDALTWQELHSSWSGPHHWAVSYKMSGVKLLVCLGFCNTTLGFPFSSESMPSQAPGVLQGGVGCSLLLALSDVTMAQRSTYMLMCPSLYPFNGWIIFIAYMYHILFIHSSVDRYLGCFYILAIVNNDRKNICSSPCFRFLWYICRSKIAGSYGSSMLTFWETTKLFSIAVTILHSHLLHILINICYV